MKLIRLKPGKLYRLRESLSNRLQFYIVAHRKTYYPSHEENFLFIGLLSEIIEGEVYEALRFLSPEGQVVERMCYDWANIEETWFKEVGL